MSKHILAVGNGNQLTEVTKHGVLLVYKWDVRRGEYVAHSGDWTGTDGVNAKRGTSAALLPLLSSLEMQNERAIECAALDDYYTSLPSEAGVW